MMFKTPIRAGIFPALLLALAPAAQGQDGAPTLQQPIDCTLGDTCFIQNYVDTDPGPDYRDFTCAALSYDGHKGTDFALPSLAAMEAGVDVYAAAPGVVRGLRDGMIDRLYTPEEDARIDGRDCGNGMVLDHGNGWQTQYCHMKQGSVTVAKGDRVEAGQVLGQVGISGRSQFPHLHISVRKDGEVVDPFLPGQAPDTCGAPGGATMWSGDIAYQAGGVLSAGFATAVPAYDDIKAGTAHSARIAATAPAIVVWGYAFGGRQADVMELTIDGPQGRIFDTRQLIKGNKAQFFRAAGRRLSDPLTPGAYTGTVKLERRGEVISTKTVPLTVE